MRPVAAVLAGLALLLSACGGGSDGGLTEKRAGEVAEQYAAHFFGILTGDVKPQQLIDDFAPECREGISPADIEAALGFIRLFMPNLGDIEIEDVDLGKLKFEKTDDGILVAPEDPSAIRLKVKGQFVNAEELFAEMGFEDAEDSPADGAEPLLVVERDGKAYIGDCSDLQDFSS